MIKHSTKEAFISGFWKGASAPVSLFSEHIAERREPPELKPIHTRNIPTSAAEALAKDWRVVGQDLCAAFEIYGKK